jgi:hypothetical protein
VAAYPVFRNPATPLRIGTSLCRLGYPFNQIKADFDEATNGFNFAPGTYPVPRFPNDGIHTRVVMAAIRNGGRTVKHIETSTPGLRGQSGGPVFDRDGHVWGIQTRTQHMPLGFSPKIKEGSREVTEHQFMHVGWAVHVEEILAFLKQHNVAVALS